MDTLHHHHRHGRQLTLIVATVTTLAFLLLASLSALGFSSSRQFSKFSLKTTGRTVGFGHVRKVKEEVVERVLARRRLGGPGSSPPTCRSKCGRCAPCQPVHVPIQPGFSMKLEYYPEAWRCKCRNMLFMP